MLYRECAKTNRMPKTLEIYEAQPEIAKNGQYAQYGAEMVKTLNKGLEENA